MRKDLLSLVTEQNIPDDMLFDVIYEYYAGGSKELEQCEKYLAELKELAGGHSIGDGFKKITSKTINERTPANKKLEDTLARFFNVNKVRIYWNNEGRPGGYTRTNSAIMRNSYKTNLEKGNKSNFNVYTFIAIEMFTICDLTPREALAVILHEIGHNFYFCPFQTFFELMASILSIGLLPLANLGAKYISIGAQIISDWLTENVAIYRILGNAVAAVDRVLYEVRSFTGFTKTMLSVLSGSGKFIRQNPIIALFAYGAEKGADSFAAKYGYGNDLVSALKKLRVTPESKYGEMVEKTAFFNLTNQIKNLTSDVILMMTLECHPSITVRAQSTLRKLKDDYKKGDYPPELKKNLEKEIENLEKTMTTVNVYSKNTNAPQIAQGIHGLMDKLTFGHNDIREIFNFYYDSLRF